MSFLKNLATTVLGLAIIAALTPLYPPLPVFAAIVAIVVVVMREAQRRQLSRAWAAVERG